MLVSGAELGEHAVSPQPRVPTPSPCPVLRQLTQGLLGGDLFSPHRSSAPSRLGGCSCMCVEVRGCPFQYPGSVFLQYHGELNHHTPPLEVDVLIDWSFPGGAVVKNLPTSGGDARDLGSVPGSGRCPEVGNGKPLQ